jgi:hypothetical protein
VCVGVFVWACVGVGDFFCVVGVGVFVWACVWVWVILCVFGCVGVGVYRRVCGGGCVYFLVYLFSNIYICNIKFPKHTLHLPVHTSACYLHLAVPIPKQSAILPPHIQTGLPVDCCV